MSKTVVKYNDVAPGAAESAVFSTQANTAFSEIELLRSDEYEQKNIATLEMNEWYGDGTFELFESQTVPFWSEEISGKDCLYESPPPISITFPNLYSSLGISIVFDQNDGAWAGKVNVKWHRGDELLSDKNFYPDQYNFFCENRVLSWNRIEISVISSNVPQRYAKIRQIIFGIYRKFGMSEMRSATVTNQINLISSQLPISTFNCTLDTRENIEFMFQLKQSIEVYNDDLLLGVYYIEEHSRSALTVYNLNCHDAFGILDLDTFPGGVYVEYSAKQLLLDIISEGFEVDFGEVEDFQLTGILTSQKKREAIQQVLFAWGVCAATDGTEKIRVFYPGVEAEDVSVNRTYTGVTVNTSAIVTEVRVTAHEYTEAENGNLEINGKKYSDTETVYTVKRPNLAVNEKQNVVEVTNATLISNAIGQEVAQRVYNYYSMRDTSKAKIVWNGEFLGDKITVPNSWGENKTGNITRMDYKISNTVAADCEIIG